MPFLLFLLKGGIIVTVLRQVFLMVWNSHLYQTIRNEARIKGLHIVDIRKPGRKHLLNSPFVIDPNHVNKNQDWIYYRIVETQEKQSTTKADYWVKVVLDKNGVATSTWVAADTAPKR